MHALREWFSNPNVIQGAEAVGGIILIYLATRLVYLILKRYVSEASARYHARKLISLFGYLLSVLLVLAVFHNRLREFSVFLGVAAAGIAVALREVILSIAGWVTIWFGGLYRAGDRIEIAGQRGDVIDISILRTTLMEIGQWVKSDLYNGRIVRVSNSAIFQQPVFNFSGDFPFLWDEFTVPIRFDSDYELARDIMCKAAEGIVAQYTEDAKSHWHRMRASFRVEDANVEPMVTLVANSNWVEYTVRYVVDYRKRRSTMNLIFTRILEEFARTEGKVRMASTTQEVVGFPELSVKMEDSVEGPQRPS